MPSNRPTVLLTGFGPFPSVGANATSVLVPRLAAMARRALPGIAIEDHILPTEWLASLEQIAWLYDRLTPSVALHFGVSSRAIGFEIEVRGRNVCSLSEDAAGLLPPGPAISPDGPEHLPARLPAAHIVTRLRRRGLTALLSRDAGGYLCNALLYRSLELARTSPATVRCGFVHLPASLVSERQPELEPLTGGRLDWNGALTGGLEIIAASLGRPAPDAARIASLPIPRQPAGRGPRPGRPMVAAARQN